MWRKVTKDTWMIVLLGGLIRSPFYSMMKAIFYLIAPKKGSNFMTKGAFCGKKLGG